MKKEECLDWYITTLKQFHNKKQNMKKLAKVVYWDYLIYKEYLLDNGLDDDSNSITVDELHDFVNNEISVEERESIERNLFGATIARY